MKFKIDEIWVSDEAVDYPLTGEIIRKCPGAKLISGSELDNRRSRQVLNPDPFREGKRIIHLIEHKGSFVKPCPGTNQYVCCGLEILHIGQGCPMDCTYCALQVYFNKPVMEVFVNRDKMLRALEDHISSDPDGFHRICTGEFTDSLALDPLTNLSPVLVEFFANQTNASLEIKTKTTLIEPLLDVNPKGRVILSFSMNSQHISTNEEIRAAGIESRLKAAQEASSRGYKIGFHFDPIIPHPGWRGGYSETVDRIFARIDPAAIAWISLGTIRFVPELKDISTTRFGRKQYFCEAFSSGLDGKKRLFIEKRVEIFRFTAEAIWRHDPSVCIYLCMEAPYVWEKALGVQMNNDAELTAYLDRVAKS
jgi:spore photoproduct lyase